MGLLMAQLKLETNGFMKKDLNNRVIELNYVELLDINGGAVGGPVPVISNNKNVQAGYEIGYRVGRALVMQLQIL